MRSVGCGELPLETAELCIESNDQSQAEILAAASDNKISAEVSPTTGNSKTPEKMKFGKTPIRLLGKTIEGSFCQGRKEGTRVGTIVIPCGEELFRDFQSLCSNMAVKSVELCRGTDRFRLPKENISLETIPLRQTFVMHRETGEVYELGKPEEWTKLPPN